MKDPSGSQVQRNLSTNRPWKNGLVGLMTAAGFVFFARFWLLFLPVNVMGILAPVFEAASRWLRHLRPGSPSTLGYGLPYLGAAVILLIVTVGGSTVLYHRLACAARSRAASVLALFMVLSLLLGWLLWPRRCDTHESFKDVPNRTCSCIGATFSFYPPFVLDGTTSDYCLGWEVPVQP